MPRKHVPWPLLYVLCGILFSLPMVVPLAAPLAYVAAALVYLEEYDRSDPGENEKKHPLLRAYGRGFLFLYTYKILFSNYSPLNFLF